MPEIPEMWKSGQPRDYFHQIRSIVLEIFGAHCVVQQMIVKKTINYRGKIPLTKLAHLAIQPTSKSSIDSHKIVSLNTNWRLKSMVYVATSKHHYRRNDEKFMWDTEKGDILTRYSGGKAYALVGKNLAKPRPLATFLFDYNNHWRVNKSYVVFSSIFHFDALFVCTPDGTKCFCRQFWSRFE